MITTSKIPSKISWWLDSNREPLLSEETAVPTEQCDRVMELEIV